MKNQTLLYRNLSAAFLLTLSVLIYGAQEVRKLKGFDQISFNISGDLILTQGDAFKVVIEGPESDIEKIKTEVEGKNLIVKSKTSFSNFNDVKVYVTLPELKGIALSGSGDVIAEKKFDVKNLNLTVSGSGDINFGTLQAENINAVISGSGDIKLKGGQSSTLNLSINGSGDISSVELEAKDVKVSISGSGTARVFASNTLNSNIVGSGDVYYKGNPLVNANAVGSGSTKAL